ncbi:hypothetical protein Tgr7_0069 [Thioalkalivibrio sulfidiphilus HL-EbGr7]|uniref:Cytochrome c-552/4 domain-containing protein n=1 Tax=Thioalkalivibrio sulfidiphilus (strain HL-EbGR7) TaxID=396588 RepID=B8GTB3_THISH|nr:multiheme c-type cytochrome [Thioalkalivibrio sulfidiphilus]ACL71173.1 hypothetical protein Tgr7_0069 [Thioalkalivibrio sulfidiphilus HL-EbGr7]
MKSRTAYRLLAAVAILGLLTLVALPFLSLENGGQGRVAGTDGDFLDQHWAFPLAPQGAPPHDFSFNEASLDARSCAQCHASQFEDWKTSRHSQTMNAGIRWQFHVFSQAESNKCMDCHSPLAEQKALVARELGWPNAPAAAPPDHIPSGLHHQGLTCAACHVRGHQRFGPEHRLGLSGDEPGLPHGGFHPRPAFSDSRFCAACHQFPEDGPKLNGKLRQDTYNEWLRSRFAEQGVSCQNCHMPDRRHLWRGITDPDTVRSAMAIDLHGAPGSGDVMELTLRIANVGAGHHFPAYMVPRIDVYLELLDPDSNVRARVIHHVIQWRASVDLTQEEFDTRLPAGESVSLDGRIRMPNEPGWSLGLRLEVAPKEHYERMYQDMMRQADRMDPMTLDLLRIAIFEARQSRYRAVQERLSLDEPVSLTLRYTPMVSLSKD